MVNTEEKYGIRNRQAIMLFVQMVLIKIGLLIQIFVLIFTIMYKLDSFMIVSAIAMILAHLAVLVYGYIGYKKGKVFYHLTLWLFLLAILVNVIFPLRDVPQRILLTLLFGLIAIFPFKQEDYKFTNVLVFIASMVALGFSIYSSITADPNFLGENKVVPEIIMYLSIFAPVVLVGLFGVSYNAKYEKEHHLKE